MYQEHRTYFDWSIVWATGGLVFIGLLNLYSATLEPTGAAGRYFVLQLIYVVMGVVVAAVCIVADYRVHLRPVTAR